MPSLFEAVAKRDLRAAEKAFADHPEDGAGALENAAETGCLSIVRFLVGQGVRHDWAIVNAARFGHLRVIRFLAQNAGGNMNAAFIAAAAHGQGSAVRLLMKLIEKPPLDEALADACLKGYGDIALFLRRAGADPFAAVYGGRTAVGLAEENGRADLAAALKKSTSRTPNKSK